MKETRRHTSLHDAAEGCLLTHPATSTSANCLTQALITARAGRDEIMFMAPATVPDAEGHVVLRDIATGTVREAGPPVGDSAVMTGAYSAAHGLTFLGAATLEELQALLAVPPAMRARHVAERGGILAAVAHRCFGAVGAITPIPQMPPPPPGGSQTDGQDQPVDAWLNALGGALSQSDKNALAQTSEDAHTLLSWFDSHKRGDPALNDMPQNVADAENRLLSNPSISQQIHSGEVVTRDAIGNFVNGLDNAADSAKSSFQVFQKNNPDADSSEIGAAAQASILQADLPILDASGGASAVDGKIDIADVQAVATSDASGMPDPLKQAALAYSSQSSFDTLANAGNAGNGLANSGSFANLISNGVGFSRPDSDVHNWANDLGDAVSDDDKKALEQIGDDATTLQSWFNSHQRGDPALNDMPQNIADAENRLLSNPAISKQIESGGDVTRDALGNFLNSLNGAANSAQKDWDSFKKSDNAGNPVAQQLAADADILRANLPVYDAAGSSAAKTDGAFNTDDLKAISSGDGSKGLPSDLTNAAKLFSDPGMFAILDTSGDNLATPHPDGLSDTGNLDNFVSKQAGTINSTTLGQMLSEAADRSMVSGVDTSKLGPDVFNNPGNYSGAQKAAMIQQLQDLNTQLEAGVAQDNWVDTLFAGTAINTDYKQVQGDIAQKIAQLSQDPDVQKFRQDNYANTLQSIVQADPNLNKAIQSYYDGDVKDGTALKDALASKDASGNTLSPEDALASFMQTANTLNLGLGSGGNPKDSQIDFQGIAQKSGQQDALQQAYESDILSGNELSDAIKNGTDMTTAIENFQADAANFGAVLPGDYIAQNADKLQQTFADTVTNGTLDNATSDDITTAFLDSNGNVDTNKLTDAINQAIQSDPDLGKDSNGEPLSVSQVVSTLSGIINENRNTVKLQDSLNKYAKAAGIDGPPKPSGGAADAYNRGVLHLMSAALTGGVLAAKEAGSSSNSQGYVDATRLGAGMQISGALLESGTKYLKDTGNNIFSDSQLKTIENSGKALGGIGGAIGGALGIFSGVESIKDGDTAGGALGITNGITSLLSGVSSAVEGGINLTGVGGAEAAAAAGAIGGALGIAGGIIGALSAVAIGLYEGIAAAVKNVQFTNQFVDDAGKLGITGGNEPSNFPDPNTAPSDNSPPP
jgi:hypothetical protein